MMRTACCVDASIPGPKVIFRLALSGICASAK